MMEVGKEHVSIKAVVDVKKHSQKEKEETGGKIWES